MLSTRERTDTWTVVGIWREGRYFGVRGIEKYSRRQKYKASSAVIAAIHKTAVRGLSTSTDEYDSGPSWYTRLTCSISSKRKDRLIYAHTEYTIVVAQWSSIAI